MHDLSEQFFGTENDPDQMPISMESFEKLQRLHLKTIVYKLENGEPISWVVVVPTTITLMEKFLQVFLEEVEMNGERIPRFKEIDLN